MRRFLRFSFMRKLNFEEKMGLRESLRREKLMKVMDDENLDGYLVVDPVNVSYLTGFQGEDSFLWIGDVGACLLSDTRFEEQIKEECPDIGAAIRCSGQTTLGLLRGAIADSAFSSKAPNRIGIEGASTTVALLNALRGMFPSAEFVARNSDVERLRSIKDETEISEIRQAIDITIRAYRVLRKTATNDMTEVDLRDELEYRMRKEGGDEVSFPSIVAFDARAALPHAIPQRKGQLGDSNMVLIDWGEKRNGYVGDLTRAFLTEKGESLASREYRARFESIFKIVLEAHDKAIEMIKPGASCREIDKVARDVIREAGYGDYYGHGLGHGIGRVVHDYGGFSPSAQGVVEENMIITVEPGIYLPGWGGIRIEDDVLATPDGCEIMSSNLRVDE